MKEITVALAALDSTDMGWVREGRNDHAVWKWCRQNDFLSDAEQVRWFNRQSEDPTIKMYKVMCQTDEQRAPAGVCGLTSIDHVNRRAEFSLWIKPALQGRGLGKIALKVLLHHGFMNLGLNVIWGETFETNVAQMLFEKIGFKHEGTRRQFYFRDGRFIDAHLFSITAEEFYAARLSAIADSQSASDRGSSVAPDSLSDPEGSVQPDQRGDSGAAREVGEEKADLA